MTLQIVVAGAGYAGLAAAKLAVRWTDAQVTLVNAHENFVERVRLHQVATGQEVRDRPLAELLAGTGVDLVVDRITGIDAQRRQIRTASGRILTYDKLIYALGSHADMGSVPGAAEHAYTVAGVEQARALRARLPEAQSVVVAGAGLTGIETAAEIADSYPALKVRLVTGGEPGAALSERARRYLRQTFARLGVEIRDGARITEVRADGLVLDSGDHVGADTVVWTSGFTVPDLARKAGFAVDKAGRMLVDDTLRSVSHPDVIAIGDAAAMHRPDGQELRMACATGLPSAQIATRAMAARLSGREPKPLRYRYYGQCISLGRNDGVVQLVHADDSPRDAILTGRLAARVKEMVVRATVLFERHPTLPTGA